MSHSHLFFVKRKAQSTILSVVGILVFFLGIMMTLGIINIPLSTNCAFGQGQLIVMSPFGGQGSYSMPVGTYCYSQPTTVSITAYPATNYELLSWSVTLYPVYSQSIVASTIVLTVKPGDTWAVQAVFTTCPYSVSNGQNVYTCTNAQGTYTVPSVSTSVSGSSTTYIQPTQTSSSYATTSGNTVTYTQTQTNQIISPSMSMAQLSGILLAVIGLAIVVVSVRRRE
jgi:hypothetical protein